MVFTSIIYDFRFNHCLPTCSSYLYHRSRKDLQANEYIFLGPLEECPYHGLGCGKESECVASWSHFRLSIQIMDLFLQFGHSLLLISILLSLFLVARIFIFQIPPFSIPPCVSRSLGGDPLGAHRAITNKLIMAGPRNVL